ncbi:MAG: elongation factor P maturation arginine rhamnosyltransferase EarP [Sulfuricella sp.]
MEQETSTSDNSRPSWDIFSVIVDNYGDIGVCWRLARQLAAEHDLKVRLWTDDLISFKKINPEIDPRLPTQVSRGVEIRQWAESNIAVEPADVVIEAFACELPAAYVAAMAKSGRRHAWINLEYLSAEGWVDSHHGLPSPHPRLPLIKYFFFPGFTPSTGGLLVEKNCVEQRAIFQADIQQCTVFWQELGIPAPEKNEVRISLFCYDNNSALSLFTDWAKGTTPVSCLVPEGVATKQISAFFGLPYFGAGNLFKKGSLIVRVLPFLEQDRYDQLLWACNFNFVRGEDSLIRAQWAARPMVWQIYPQEAGAHGPKLRAFLDRYCADLPQPTEAVLTQFFEAWNGGGSGIPDWESLWRHRSTLEKHTRKWANRLIKKEDLTTNLVNFCNIKLK